MLVLLPPSEGKRLLTHGPVLDVAALSFCDLQRTREVLLDRLIALCGRPAQAVRALGLGPTQRGDIARNRDLRSAPTGAAITIYRGVLYEALDAATLPRAAQGRLDTMVAISSALWGLLRPSDPIPAYRLSGDIRLPVIGPVAQAWREPMTAVLQDQVGPIIDLRSTSYQFGVLPRRDDVAVGRVLLERDGRRSVVSHHNKATKGRAVRALLTASRRPRTLDDAVAILAGHGFTCEISTTARGQQLLDIITSQV